MTATTAHTLVNATANAPTSVPAPAVHRVNLHDFLVKQVGRFVGLDFVKADGSVRRLNGRLGVRKHLKGGVNNVVGDSRPYLVLFDMQKRAYRHVNLATVGQVRARNSRFAVIG